MTLKSVRTVELHCPVTDSDVTARIGAHAVPESDSGHHANFHAWDSPIDCTGKRSCGSWASQPCPLFFQQSQE